MTITKAITANDTVNGAAYINPNSLNIPPSTVQRVDSAAQNENLFGISGVLQDRLNFWSDVVDANIVQITGETVSPTDEFDANVVQVSGEPVSIGDFK